jgi:uncharacterized membrane protein
MTGTTDRYGFTTDLSGPTAVTHFAVLALAVGYTVTVVVHDPPLASMVGGNLLSSTERVQLLTSVVVWTVIAAVAMVAGFRWLQHRTGWPATIGELIAGLWPLSLLPVAWYVFDTRIWLMAPLLLYVICLATFAYCVLRTEWPGGRESRPLPSTLRKIAAPSILILAITAYVVYVSIHSIANHYSLGTAAYDLGIHENTLWNTVHGDFFYSSIEGGSHLGVHTSFIMLIMVPFYAVAPSTETVLVIQALVLGLAAWPLFLLARKMLDHSGQALAIALIWLAHPAVGGANFYDFHAVAFAPVLLFTAAFFWWDERWLPFWVAVALLLSVKEEMAILVLLLGLATVVGGRRAHGAALIAVGVAAYVVLQHVVIPHFAGDQHSYAWYYTDMIPGGEGPRGLLVTALLNPVFTLGHALTQPKILFVLQLFAPLALLPFASARGALLVSYGLAATILASRPALHQIGFQYALTLLAMGCIAALLALHRRSPRFRNRALAAAVMLAIVTCFHYGMIWPRHNFTGGFNTIDFDYSEADRARHAELQRLIDLIPDEATVLASENLVPHVARRHTVDTERYARHRQSILYDAILVHNNDTPQRLRELPHLGGLRGYELAERTRHFVLFIRRTG